VKIEFPAPAGIADRLNTVLTTLYLLFNEGYYSRSQNISLRKDLCIEAMRLAYLLTENFITAQPAVYALLALMCFHASRFEARIGQEDESILYGEQDTTLWDQELIKRGQFYMNKASADGRFTKYHVEAAIAYWHTNRTDSPEKWESILRLYNTLLMLEYSPIAALNRTYALAKAYGKEAGIIEAEKLKLDDNYLYHCLLGYLYMDVENTRSLIHFETALKQARARADKAQIRRYIKQLTIPAV
jgi:predicted RNA polymerase sigma factor